MSTQAGNTEPGPSGATFVNKDEDLIVFNARRLGPRTAGTFERYFDGSDVGLLDEGEDLWAAGSTGQRPSAPDPEKKFEVPGVGVLDQDLGMWHLVDPILADLRGADEVPSGSGDPEGRGMTQIALDSNAGIVCFDIETHGRLEAERRSKHVPNGRTIGIDPGSCSFGRVDRTTDRTRQGAPGAPSDVPGPPGASTL